MIIYKDKISGDELFSDTYPITLVDDIVYKVQGKQVTETAGDYDSVIGANPSAEDAAEGLEENAVSGINIVLANRLVETCFDKKSYQVYLKEYMKKIKERLTAEDPARAEVFTANVTKFVKNVLGNFKDYQFFLGESMNNDAMVALANWEDNQPVLYFFKDGLDEEKV